MEGKEWREGEGKGREERRGEWREGEGRGGEGRGRGERRGEGRGRKGRGGERRRERESGVEIDELPFSIMIIWSTT